MSISLSSLITENPDRIIYKGDRYKFNEEGVLASFSVIHDLKDKKNVVVASVQKLGWRLVSDSEDINAEVRPMPITSWSDQEMPYHNDIHRLLMKFGRMSGMWRTNALICGRTFEVFDGPGNFKVITSFWNGHAKCRSYLNEIKKYYQLMNLDITKSLFEFLNDQGNFLTYAQAFASITPLTKKDDTIDPEDLKVMHVASPEKKKQILGKLGAAGPDKIKSLADKLNMTPIELKRKLGMDVAESTISETPDRIGVRGDGEDDDITFLRFTDYWAIVGVGTIFSFDYKNKSRTCRAVLRTNTSDVIIDGKVVSRYYGAVKTHMGLQNHINTEIYPLNNFEGHIEFRVFEFKGKIYVSFWENITECKRFLKEIEKCLLDLDIDYKKCFYQVFGMNIDQFITYDHLSGKPDDVKSSESEEWDAAKALHLLPPSEKANFLKKIGADQPNKLQSLADKMGIPLIKLKQMLNKEVDETQDIDRNINPEKSYNLYNLDLDTAPPIALRTHANEDITQHLCESMGISSSELDKRLIVND